MIIHTQEMTKDVGLLCLKKRHTFY